VHIVFTELPAAVDGLAAIREGTSEPLREPGRVPPEPPRLIIDADVLDPEDTPRIEVMHTRAGLGFGCRIEVLRVFHAIAPGEPMMEPESGKSRWSVRARWIRKRSPSSHSTIAVPCATTPGRAGWVASMVQMPTRRLSCVSAGSVVMDIAQIAR